MNTSCDNFLWVEKYRPRTIDDCILCDELKATFKDIVRSGEIQNMLLCGSSGTGKTTVVKALCDEMNVDMLFINASENGNIDTLRTTIRNFASTVSISGGKKVVILDEADYLNASSTMPALRGFFEEFSKNCRFILTCNFRNRIIEPIQSRCAVVEFKIPLKEKSKIAEVFFSRVCGILSKENVKFDKKSVAQLVAKHFPDFRRTLTELQRYAVSGEINSGILAKLGEAQIADLIGFMKAKNYSDVRKWIAQNSDTDCNTIFRKIYDSLSTVVDKASIPNIILILAEYQYKMAFVADQEINMAACMAEIMLNATFT